MTSETRVFGLLAGFLFLTAVVYAGWTGAETGGVERAGTAALLVSALLCTMMTASFWLISRRIEPRPEDRRDAEPSDGAGDVGFFSPFSYWPFGVAVAALVAAVGVVVWQLWMVALGLVGCVVAVAGLLFEYYTGARSAH